MAGLLVFSTISEALKAGFVVYDKTHDGYVVRRRSKDGWENALVVLTDGA